MVFLTKVHFFYCFIQFSALDFFFRKELRCLVFKLLHVVVVVLDDNVVVHVSPALPHRTELDKKEEEKEGEDKSQPRSIRDRRRPREKRRSTGVSFWTQDVRRSRTHARLHAHTHTHIRITSQVTQSC